MRSGRVGERERERSACVFVCLRKSTHVGALISVPLNGHGLLKCLYRTPRLSRGLWAELCSGQGEEEEAGERMVKDSYAID